MATQKETIEFIFTKLRNSERFTARAMFGEYALYADGKVVGFVCDNLLYVKIFPESHELEAICEKGHPYPGSKLYYILEETQLSTITNLSAILLSIARCIQIKRKNCTPTTII